LKTEVRSHLYSLFLLLSQRSDLFQFNLLTVFRH